MKDVFFRLVRVGNFCWRGEAGIDGHYAVNGRRSQETRRVLRARKEKKREVN